MKKSYFLQSVWTAELIDFMVNFIKYPVQNVAWKQPSETMNFTRFGRNPDCIFLQYQEHSKHSNDSPLQPPQSEPGHHHFHTPELTGTKIGRDRADLVPHGISVTLSVWTETCTKHKQAVSTDAWKSRYSQRLLYPARTRSQVEVSHGIPGMWWYQATHHHASTHQRSLHQLYTTTQPEYQCKNADCATLMKSSWYKNTKNRQNQH